MKIKCPKCRENAELAPDFSYVKCGGISVTLTVVVFKTLQLPLIFHVLGLSGCRWNVPLNSSIQGGSGGILFPLRRAKHALITVLGFLFKMLVANPTAIPEDPLRMIVGTMGRKYSGSILNTHDWTFMVGQRAWQLDQNYFTSVKELLDDGSLTLQASKGFFFHVTNKFMTFHFVIWII
mgnify:CR=1 FL=1